MNPNPNPNPNPKQDPKEDPKDKPQLGQEKKQSGQQQMQGGEGKQYGEGSYSGTRQYNEGVKDHMQHHDVEREARDAAPRTAAEEQDMKKAERLARSKSRGEGATPDGNAADEEGGSERDPNT